MNSNLERDRYLDKVIKDIHEQIDKRAGETKDLKKEMRASVLGNNHWGQGPVYPAGTLQVHRKEMDKVPTKNPSGTLQSHSEFPKPISLQCSQHRKWPVHSQCSRSCDCSVPIR